MIARPTYKIQNRRLFRLLPVTLLFVLAETGMAFPQTAPVTVEATADTNAIRIGEQIKLQLRATSDGKTAITFPVLPDTLHGLEVVKRGSIDTMASEDGKRFTYSQQFEITSFDSGYYVLEPFPFLVTDKSGKKDTLNTEALLVSVRTIAVDTTKEIKDIKKTMDVPFNWKELLPYIIGILILALLVYLGIRELRRKSNVPEAPKPKAPPRPAHLIALEALKRIEEEKLWQQGMYKSYHSEVSDTIRTYIEGRFGIPAMESTTDEILDHFRSASISSEANEKLRQLLQLADMVKFAKSIPVGSENERSMQDAYSFIYLTKPVDPSDFEKQEAMP